MIKKFTRYLIVLLITLFLITTIALFIENRKVNNLSEEYSDIYKDKKYSDAVIIDNIALVKQKYSCGYAVIEMFSSFTNDAISEQALFDKYGKIVTSSGSSFCKEMNKNFTDYNTTMYRYLTNKEMIERIYNSLSNGIPVPFEWAAKNKDDWTLHYSLIVGLDIPKDKIWILNPYGYEEELSLKEFFDRTSFKAYEDKPLYLKLAFAFGFFEKNTIFIAEPK